MGEHEMRIANFPETHWRDSEQRGYGSFYHVGVRHSKAEENGMQHLCANVNPQAQERAVHSCECICWESGGAELLPARMEFSVYDSSVNVTGWTLMAVNDFEKHKVALQQFYN